ncbi:MAG: hypothetical protein LUD07_03605 [Clostridiales bacterium]|nr:hypothetical protein [Clostridiales bacterium]
MKIKKIIALSLTAVLLAGCSGQSSQNSIETTQTETIQETEITEESLSENFLPGNGPQADGRPDKGAGAPDGSSEQGHEGPDRQNGGGFRQGNGGGMIDKSSDEDLNALLAETQEKFEQIDYTDEITGKSFAYNFFIPDEYDESQEYPLVLFITDSSVVGKETTAALTQGYGALVWVTDEDQQKHPSFVIAPEFPENILVGEGTASEYVDALLHLLTSVQETYRIDENRIYITGQSMGCMTALYLNGTYPDLFAASLYVDGQWSTDILAPLEGQTFFYFAAEGDEKASTGMQNVIDMFDADGVSYGSSVLNAKDSEDVISQSITDIIAQGYSANFISWEKGSVLPDDMNGFEGNEHMYSFDHPYKIRVLRDWLFEQVLTR